MRKKSEPLDFEFWRKFSKSNWNRKPGVFKNVEIPIDEEEFFAGLIDTFSIARDVNPNVFRFNIGEEKVPPEHLSKWMPVKKDKDLDGYLARLTSQLRGRKFFFNISNIQASMPKTFHRFKAMLPHLFSQIGFPTGPRSVELEVFMGNYKRTPGGIHEDQASVFCFPIRGLKKMRAWPHTAFRSREALFRGSNQHSRLLVAEKGDFIFWPHTYWHVAEGDGRLNASINLALFYDSNEVDLVNHLSEEIFQKRSTARLSRMRKNLRESHTHISFRDGAFPPELKKAWSELFSVHKKNFQCDLEKLWLKRVSSSGFRDIPPIKQKVKLQSRVKVESDCGALIYFEKVGQRGIIAFGGHLLEIPYHSKIKKIVTWLRTGQKLTVGELCDQLTNGTLGMFRDRSAAKIFVEGLVSIGAMRAVH